MKRELRRHKDEPLYRWVERLCDYISNISVSSGELKEILSELSKESYIQGSNAVTEVLSRK